MQLGKAGDAVFQKKDGDHLKQCFFSGVPHNMFRRVLDKSWNTYIEILKYGEKNYKYTLKYSQNFCVVIGNLRAIKTAFLFPSLYMFS